MTIIQEFITIQNVILLISSILGVRIIYGLLSNGSMKVFIFKISGILFSFYLLFTWFYNLVGIDNTRSLLGAISITIVVLYTWKMTKFHKFIIPTIYALLLFQVFNPTFVSFYSLIKGVLF